MHDSRVKEHLIRNTARLYTCTKDARRNHGERAHATVHERTASCNWEPHPKATGKEKEKGMAKATPPLRAPHPNRRQRTGASLQRRKHASIARRKGRRRGGLWLPRLELVRGSRRVARSRHRLVRESSLAFLHCLLCYPPIPRQDGIGDKAPTLWLLLLTVLQAGAELMCYRNQEGNAVFF